MLLVSFLRVGRVHKVLFNIEKDLKSRTAVTPGKTTSIGLLNGRETGGPGAAGHASRTYEAFRVCSGRISAPSRSMSK